MYVRDYLQGSENGRVVISMTRTCLQTIKTIAEGTGCVYWHNGVISSRKWKKDNG